MACRAVVVRHDLLAWCRESQVGMLVPGDAGAKLPADNGLVPDLLREGRVTANGLRFAYLEGGSGPLVVLLHGWPDTPHTWDHQLAALAGAGFRVAAPWLRGYPPTEIPGSGYFDIGTLAVDVRELIRVLGGGDPCLLVGQDWGASIGYQGLAAFPEVVRSAVLMAVPHPAATRESLLRAEHVHRSFHWFFFQLPHLPERALSADNFAFVDWLWTLDRTRLHRCRAPSRGQAHAGRTGRAGGDTRLLPGIVRPGPSGPGPSRGTAGSGPADRGPDPGPVRRRGQARRSDARPGRVLRRPVPVRLVPGSSHFLQREQPQAVTRLILDWFARQ